MENWVGFRFSPTDEEVVDHYVRLKNLGGDTSHVDNVISTVDICSLEPWELPHHSRMRESKDQVWYFFGRKENKYKRGERQSRQTNCGSWKKTGDTMKIFRKRGNHEQIGEKKVLVFHSGASKSKTDWVMHEYTATFLPPTLMTYTMCKVTFKGDASDVEHIITRMNNSGGSEGLQNPRHFNGLLDAEKETQIDDAIRRAIFDNVSTPDFDCFLDFNANYNEEEEGNTMFMDDRNDYKPKPSLTGFISGDDEGSDSDLVSATTAGSIQTSSTYSFGSSNRCIDQITDLQNSPNSTTTTELVSLTQVVSETLETSLDASKEKYDVVQGTEKGKYEMDQKVINNKRTGFFYRKIRSCIKKTLLCSSIPVKHDN